MRISADGSIFIIPGDNQPKHVSTKLNYFLIWLMQYLVQATFDFKQLPKLFCKLDCTTLPAGGVANIFDMYECMYCMNVLRTGLNRIYSARMTIYGEFPIVNLVDFISIPYCKWNDPNVFFLVFINHSFYTFNRTRDSDNFTDIEQGV